MKRIVSLIMAVALMAALCVGANAATVSPTLTEGEGNQELDVTITVTQANQAAKKYKVDIVWDLEFSYSFGEWDTSALKYTGNWNDASGSIQVKNYSNNAIKYDVGGFVPETDYSGVVLKYNTDEDSLADMPVESADANVTATNHTGQVQTSTVTVTASGTPKNATVSAGTKIGTVTVSISPST